MDFSVTLSFTLSRSSDRLYSDIYIYIVIRKNKQRDYIFVPTSLFRDELSSLNKRNEHVSPCRHRNKALLRYS